jgi:GNAT superfamily N-acetyltransferase
VIRIRIMGMSDLPLGLRLKREAGWNQTEADWSRFLALQPEGCFVAESDGVAVATLTTCVFKPVAWIAMVLVDRACRGRGIGRALMTHALEYLDGLGVRTVRLDATPLGRSLYDRLGFFGEYSLARVAGVPDDSGSARPARPFDPMLMDRILDLDRSATGTDRGRLIRRLADESPESVRTSGRDGEVAGYLTGRPGSNAWQVGPCIARGEAGPILMGDALSRLRHRSALVDIPLDNTEAMALAHARGLTVRREFLRMCRGEKVADERREIWASSGPEMG